MLALCDRIVAQLDVNAIAAHFGVLRTDADDEEELSTFTADREILKQAYKWKVLAEHVYRTRRSLTCIVCAGARTAGARRSCRRADSRIQRSAQVGEAC